MRVIEPHQFKGVKHPKVKKRKKHGFAFACVVIALVYIAGSLVRPLPVVTVTADAMAPPIAKDVTIAWPGYGQSAIGAVGYGVLATNGEQRALPMASVAKVMTALAVLKKHPLQIGQQGPTIVMTQEDVDDYYATVAMDGSHVPVELGEEITQYQALQALMLPSANNMANTLARWAYGSEKEYVTFVNSFTQSLGMTNTKFDDVSGYSSKTVSTAQDLARLAVNAMDNPVLAEIAAQPEATIPVAGRIYNVNMLLGRNGIVGVKTGNTEEAGGCFMAAAERMIGGQKIVAVSVIMDAPDLATALRDSIPLVNSVLDGFEQTTIIKAGQQVATYSIPWNGTVTARAEQDISGLVWRASPEKPLVNLRTPGTGADAKAEVGNITGTFGRKQVSSKVVLDKGWQAPPLLWRLTPRLM